MSIIILTPPPPPPSGAPIAPKDDPIRATYAQAHAVLDQAEADGMRVRILQDD